VPDLGAQTADLAEAGELREHLERVLAELPVHYRAPVVLRDVGGFSNEEAAQLLELDIRNFKSRLHRGRMAIRRRLEDAAGTESRARFSGSTVQQEPTELQ
jgi:RNA polymerase sigma-70 factor (ECF subfamily)